MKRIIYLFAVVALFVFVFVRTRPTPPIHTVSSPVSIIATVSGITTTNAFEVLQEYTKKEKLALKTKQYDFGIFVEQIGDLSNTKEKSWIYFVNGKAGTVAADKQPVAPGDVVEWKYITPIFE